MLLDLGCSAIANLQWTQMFTWLQIVKYTLTVFWLHLTSIRSATLHIQAVIVVTC